MGTRDNYETITRVIQAFAGSRTWKQADLARHVGVQTPALRRILNSLQLASMPLDKQDEHPHVFWSVPRHWFPGGVVFDADDWPVLVHAVLRIAHEQRRDKLLRRLLAGRRSPGLGENGLERLNQAIAATPFTDEEHEKVLLIEQSILEQVPVSMHYYSNKGQLGWRVISPQKLITEPHGRVVGFCHTNNELKWFRIDNIQRARLDRAQARKEADPEAVDAFLNSSVDGYHDGTDDVLAFRVRAPESSWVRGNLLAGMSIDPESPTGELRIVTRGAALVVARYVAGLGGAAAAEGEQLRALVRQLAAEAIEANG